MAETTRRDLLKATLGTLAAATVAAGRAVPSESRSGAAASASAAASPLAPRTFRPLPMGEVRPSGWLQRQLRIQADGLGGHLDEFWPDLGPNSGWLGGTGESWERGPYFLDGLLPLAYLLDDDVLKAKAQRFVDWTLTHQTADGRIGPASNEDWWPRMVMAKALAQYYEVSADPRVLPVLTRYFQYQLRAMPTRPLKDWGKYRWQDEVLVVQWLYERTHDPELLRLGELLERQGFDWTGAFEEGSILKEPVTREVLGVAPKGFVHEDLAMRSHGVNNGQALKVAAVRYRGSGAASARAEFDRQLDALDTYHGLPNGMFSCDEHLGGKDPSHGTELCTVVETMFSLEVVLAAFGEPKVADRIERIAFNALPGTFTDDMWAHQYDQQPNQVQVGLNSKPWTTNGPESNLYGLAPHFGCCTANFHQGWPKFTSSLWMGTADEGLAAVLYAPCEVKTTLGGTPVHLVTLTEYPFRGAVSITVSPGRPMRFPVSLRIPGWTQGASVTVNGRPMTGEVKPGTYARIDRVWSDGDRVEMRFPMEPKISRWFHRSVAVERGPLVFALSPGESWVKLREQVLTADWQVFPTRPWNYALEVDESTAGSLKVSEEPVPARPFSGEAPAVSVQVRGRRLLNWRSEDGVANPLPESPVTDAAPAEMLTLIPYAAAKLRITAFPQVRISEDRG